MTELQKSAFVGKALKVGVGKGLGVAEKVTQSKPFRAYAGVQKVRGTHAKAKQTGEETGDTLRKAQRTAAPPPGVRNVTAGSGGMTALAALDAMKKNAGGESTPASGLFGDATRGDVTRAAMPAAFAVGAAALGLMARPAIGAVGGMFERNQRNKLFQDIARRNPQMARDPRAREYFDLVMTYAPSLGKHPTAIGDFLKKQLQYPVSSTEFLHALANFEATVSQNASRGPAAHMGLAFEQGAQAATGEYMSRRKEQEAHERSREMKRYERELRLPKNE
jgi:hypothetical protein